MLDGIKMCIRDREKGNGEQYGLERREEVRRAAEDALVEFMHVEQGVDEIPGHEAGSLRKTPRHE